MNKWAFLGAVLAVALVVTMGISVYNKRIKGADLPIDAQVLTLANIERQSGPEVTIKEPGVIDLEALEDPDKIEITILTFNIRSGNDADGKQALDSIIEEVRETGAHIIGLQEVERRMPRSGFVDQAKAIAEALGFYFYYGSNINVLGVQYGNAFISKYPIVEIKNHRLPRELMEPRGVIEATVDVDGSSLHVFVTHLGLHDRERDKQMETLHGMLSEKEGPMILMGDFNNLPGSMDMAQHNMRLIDSATAMEMEDAYTYAYYSDAPNVRIDRIYTSEDIEIIDHAVRPSKTSDHLRVVTKIFQKIRTSSRNSSGFGE